MQKLLDLFKNKFRGTLYYYRFLFSRSNNEYKYLKGKKKCIVCLAADYGNLGDVAITYAQEKFLKEKFVNYVIVDFPISKTITHLKSLKKVVNNDDIITLTGGGYMGDMYFRSELLRQLIIKVFNKNKIISFPQTADFSTSSLSQELLKQAKRIYSSCANLQLMAREVVSYEFMQSNFPKNKIILTPDIVMWLDEFNPQIERTVVTFCLRQDKEKNLNTDHLVEIIQQQFTQNSIIEYYDTHIGNVSLDLNQRNIELNKIWNQFKKSKLVVTDRLHGMIFAYITGTPAVVFSNNNFKIKASYQWIKDCGYIYFIENSSEIKKINLEILYTDSIRFKKTKEKIISIFNSIQF